MGVKRIYDENCKREDLVETFERMLEEWFNQKLFDCSAPKAKDLLMEVLSAERCGIAERFISTIRKLCMIIG